MSPNITEKTNENIQNLNQYDDQERQQITYQVVDRINQHHANQIERVKIISYIRKIRKYIVIN